MIDKMQTVCVGRFLIDLPAGTTFARSQTFIDGFYVNVYPDASEAFWARVSARQKELEAQTNELGRKSLESATRIQVNGFDGRVFVFGRNSDYLMEFGKRRALEGVNLEGHVHSNGLTFNFSAEDYNPKLLGNLPKLIKQLRRVGHGEIPGSPGFCFGEGIFVDPLTADQGESTSIFVSIPGHPDIAIAFSTMAGIKPGPGLIERSARASAREPLWMRAAFKTLREGKRTINGLPGEEVAVKVTELNFSTVFGFDWEMAGKETDVYAPFLHLEMETGRNPRAGGKPVQSSLAQDAVVKLWDKISSSIRLRPWAPAAEASAAPPTAPLGSFASAGEVCPESGWWQCGDGGNGVGVLGGQRQYLRKGQRMPQALLLPPQSLWEKMKGIQRSYEAGTPTVWKLADKRVQPRGAALVPLAQAVLARADAVDAAGTASMAPEAAPVGTYVKTGAVCPSSGWWRCEEPHALDGTRWFARDSLLPPATFKVPPGLFGKSAHVPEFIHRRSSWKLVRYAESDANGAAKPDDGLRGHGDGPADEPSA